MAFDPLKSPYYKVICVREVPDQPSNYKPDVYSSETDSWTLSRISFCVKNNIQFLDAIFRNGKIHWNCYWEDSFYFDVENEPLTMPISTTEAPQMCKFDVFEMASDYSHWTLKHRLYIGEIKRDFPDITWPMMLLHSLMCALPK
ncbi:hypothetical protein Golob_007068, partial [Gossypium lobatum]|nr:hypothetical protein [Gossypium lobatum]